MPRILTLCALMAGLTAADLTTWPSQYRIDPWDTARLTPADVVGPDGIVYPDWTGVGVEGGIPTGFTAALDPASPPSGTQVFNVKTGYSAAGNGTTNDDDEVAAALAAALAWNNGTTQKAILYFPAGTYLLTRPLTINEDGVVVAGAGKASTTLKLDHGGTTYSSRSLFEFDGGTWGGTYLHGQANALRGTSTMVFDVDPAAKGYGVGTWVRIAASDASSGDTMRERYSNPNTGCDYNDPLYHFGRFFIAKITAINSAAKSATFDRTFPHDYYADEAPQMRNTTMRQWCGLQDLTIDTVSSAVTLDPVRHRRVANTWVRGVRIVEARDWPMSSQSDSRARVEIRDCDFAGTWGTIGNGSVAYLGWTQADMDGLMTGCTANGLRHMGIFQMAMRCVVRASTFSGDNVQSPQLHGRFPLENLVEQCTLGPWTAARGTTAFGIDQANTLRHGPNGPRNVFYHNDVLNGSATIYLGGASEAQILAYNRLRNAGTNSTIDANPPIWAMDRTFDTIVRGNIFDALPTSPVINLEDPTCTGWRVSENIIYNSNGQLMAGPATLAVNDFNRFRSGALPTSGAPTPGPEAASIYQWQRDHAAQSRILVVADRRALSEAGGRSVLRVVRVKAGSSGALTVTLTASPSAALDLPASVTIPDGAVVAEVVISGKAVTSDTAVTITATVSGLGLNADTDTVTVLDAASAVDPGLERPAVLTAASPAGWHNADLAQAGGGSASLSGGTMTVVGRGPKMETYMGSLGRSGRHAVWKTLSGDGSLTARLVSTTGSGDIGLMITDDIAPITEFLAVMPNRQPLGSINVNDAHASIKGTGTSPAGTAPMWLRITRTGSTLSAHTSADGSTWTQRASVDYHSWTGSGYTTTDYRSRSVLDAVMHIGLFVNNNSTTGTATATFDNISTTGTILDAAAPVWYAARPAADTATSDGFTIRARADEAGTAWYVVVPGGATAPSVDDVRWGRDASGGAALRSGSIALTTGADGVAVITGLAGSTGHDAYLVAEDRVATPNRQITATKVVATTAGGNQAPVLGVPVAGADALVVP
jgi:hypothetical protein